MKAGDARPLTAAEAALTRSVFGDAIDTDRVTVRLSKWFPFQPRDIVMAPCGHLHFHPRTRMYRDDFDEALRCHGEMTLADVRIALLETNGAISVVKRDSDNGNATTNIPDAAHQAGAGAGAVEPSASDSQSRGTR